MDPSTREWALYWPDELFKADTALKHPLHPDVTFPLKASKSCYNKPLMDKLKCFPLIKAETSTGVTKTTVSRVALKAAPLLQEIKLVPDMLQKLQEYVDLNSEEVDRRVTTKSDGKHPLPSAMDQSGEIRRLAGWFSTFQDYDTREVIVGSEAHVLSNVHSQIVNPINILLNLRYESDVNAFWKQGTEKMKRMMAESQSKDDRGSDSDFLFFPGAVCEIKTFWSVTKEHIYSILADPEFIDKHGKIVNFFKDSTHSNLVQQIWAQMHRHGFRWGFLINGEFALMFCKAGNHNDPTPKQEFLINHICGASISPFNPNNHPEQSKPFIDRRQDYVGMRKLRKEKEEEAARTDEARNRVAVKLDFGTAFPGRSGNAVTPAEAVSSMRLRPRETLKKTQKARFNLDLLKGSDKEPDMESE